MENLKSILGKHPFCKGLEQHYLELLTGCAKNVRFEAGEFIFHQGEEANHMFIIRQGKVAVEIEPPGRGPFTIQTLTDGDILGWSWLVPPYQWHYDAQAVEMTRAISLDGQCLRKKCEGDHNLGYELFKRLISIISQRVQAMNMQLLDVYGLPPKT